MSQLAETDRIMVVDDQPANLKLMEDMLRREGYTVCSFPRGRLALANAAELPPDLILLDISMPEMDGFGVCERLKADPKLASIPVIFLSALNETEDKVRALQCGGVDYVTKPFHVEEVRARVRTQLQLHRMRAELEQYTAHLEDVVSSRTRELVEAQTRLQMLDRAKGDFLKLISHELRTPLNGVLGVGQLLLGELSPGVEQDELRDMFEQSQQRILGIVENALLLTQIQTDSENFRLEVVSLDIITDRAVELAAEFAKTREVRIESDTAGMGSIFGHEDLLAKALFALLKTAVKFSRAGQTVNMCARRSADRVEIVIQSHSGTIPDEILARFFDLFSVGETVTGGRDIGLDPPVAQRIVVLFGGTVTVENRQPSGIQLTVSFTSPEVPS
jgi:two-component system, sensor histidine kinase and response regulator